MAHECPDCGQACYCNGDIDDCFFDEGAEKCTHWRECDQENDDDQDQDYWEDDEPETPSPASKPMTERGGR